MYKYEILNYPTLDALNIRREVFVLEQGFKEEDEYDSDESLYLHLYIYFDSTLIGYCRLNYVDGKSHIGRVLIKKEYREKGLGSKLLEFAEGKAKEDGYNTCYLHAQKVAVDFYLKNGYQIIGDEFLEAGAPHYYMEKYI